MKHIPMFFQTPMVQGILENRKTKTRRLKGLKKVNKDPAEWDVINYFRSDFGKSLTFQFLSRQQVEFIKCPYGQAGDILWVRETWKPKRFAGHELEGYDYKADHVKWLQSVGQVFIPGSGCETGEVWRPSIFMPKAACRIFLEVTDVKIEPLHDISPSDAVEEGIEVVVTGEMVDLYKDYMGEVNSFEFPVNSFRSLWYSINGEDSWMKNPFVWVISFRRVDKPANFL